MANRIKGIIVEIGGDTTKLQNALKGVNGQIKNTQSALKNVDLLIITLADIHAEFDERLVLLVGLSLE